VRKTCLRHRIPPGQRPLAPASSAYAVRQGRKRVEVERGGRGERGRGEREGREGRRLRRLLHRWRGGNGGSNTARGCDTGGDGGGS
jgi:hypothetical protein